MNWKRVGRWAGGAVVACELLYVLAGNGVLSSGLAERMASSQPEILQLSWDRAWSVWPGTVHLSGVRVRQQDPMMQVALTAESAKINVVLWELLGQRLHATSVQAEGVTVQLVARVDEVAGSERRLAAFPTIEGFARPALRPHPLPPLPGAEEQDGVWTVQLDGLDATLTDLWALEFRYQGAVHVTGSVGGAGALAPWPIRRVQLGPLQVDVTGGELRVGEHVVSRALTAHAALTSRSIDLPSTAGLQALAGLDASLRLQLEIADLALVETYVEGARGQGTGQLTAALEVREGKLLPGAAADLSLQGLDAQFQQFHFSGEAQAKLAVSDEAKPTAYATVGGSLRVPLDDQPLVVALKGVTATVLLSHNDLARAPALEHLSAVVGETRIQDARPLVRQATAYVPVFASLVLGEGPLTATGTVYLTPEYTLVRLVHLELGDAEFEGAAVAGAHGWTGAGAGHFGRIPVALRMRNSEVAPVLFMSPGWLGVELRKAGIEPDEAKVPVAAIPSN